MQQIWLKQEASNPDLIIYMLGWASTPNAICHIDTPGCDVLACCNYTELHPFSPERFKRYRRIYLIAWSFGIWVAEQCCRTLPLYRAIAFNGTPYPVHPQWGMRLRVVLRSMRALAKNGGENAFRCENEETPRYIPDGPYTDRTTEEKIDELMFLANSAEQQSADGLSWDKAYISDRDEIFPPAHMWEYWKTVGLGTEIKGFHYPFADPQRVLRELDPTEA